METTENSNITETDIMIREKTIGGRHFVWTAVGFLLFCLSADSLFFRGPLREKFLSAETFRMGAELLFLFLLLELGYFLRRQRGYLLPALAVSLYLWFHSVLSAVAVSFLYIFFLTVLGELILIPLHKREGLKAPMGFCRYGYSFLTGSGAYILSLCILSGWGFGSIGLFRLYTACMLAAAGLLYLFLYREGRTPVPHLPPRIVPDKKEDFWHDQCVLGAVLLLLLQAGRLNIALDYDSLRYALRTPYVLNTGRGIYENLGMVNMVYLYPKGLEILTMPLNLLGSYSFILSFSWCISLFLAVLVYEEILKRGNRLKAAAGLLLVALIPGVMNLGISAKTDMITLFFQILAAFSMLSFWEEKSLSHGLRAVSALLMSLVFKPTAFFFSGVLLFLCLFFLLSLFFSGGKKTRRAFCSLFYGKEAGARGIFFLALFVNAFVHYRTWLFTGQPLGSVFGGLWEALGMKIRYPFQAISIPPHDEGGGIVSGTLFFARRLWALFIAPVGEEFHHMLIAAPGILILLCLLRYGWLVIGDLKKKNRLQGIDILVFSVLLGSLIALHALYQVDGNYFMLLYVLVVVAFLLRLDAIKGLWKSLLLPSVLSLLLLFTTNWAGVTGLTPFSFLHRGYFPHESMFAGRMDALGMGGVRQYLKERGKVRILSMSAQPEAILFPVTAQSYTDVTGSGGNVRLVKTLADFKDFLQYAGVEYIYGEKEFLTGNARAEEIVRYMLEEESLTAVLEEGEHTLYRFTPR